MTAAKKGGRAEKAVLSRQEIATRKRALQDKRMKASGGASPARRALLGVVLLTGSLLSLLSVATFDAHDRVGPGFRNAVGPMGHLIAETLRGMLGVCAYLVPLAGLYAAVVLFVGNRDRKRLPQIISLALLTCSVAVLAQLLFAKDPGWAHPPGGALGAGLGGVMEGLFSTVGTVILVTAVSAAALIVGTQYTFFKLCSLVWAGMCVLGRRIAESSHVFWEAQKVAYKERQERVAAEKLEEAAFLAQIEADEEELAEAERLVEEAEAAEAEAMAEEAVRLARQSEKEQAAAAKQALKEGRERAKLEKKLGRGEDSPEETDAEVSSPPVEARPAEKRPAPGADPAWAASFLAPQPNPVAPDATEPPRKGRKGPQIVTAPTAATTPPPSAPAPLAPVVAEPVQPQAAAPTAGAIVPAPKSELARMPLIVEPKAPPKPTAPRKNQDQFEFIGDRKSFSLPPLDVLECDKKERSALDKDAFLVTAEKLRAKLADFGIVGEVVEIRPGPVVTMYEFLPGPGIKVSKIAALQDDLAMAMEAMRVRIVAPIPGKGVVGIEVPNRDRETVFLKEIAEQDTFQKGSSKLTMCVGKDIEGMPYVFDLAKAPHLLIAGTTGSGKSVAVNSMIMSILLKATPEEVRFIMVDPKMLELSVYEGIPHLLLPVVTDPKKAALALRWAVEEMERRYQLLSEAGVRNIAGYNKLVESSASDVKAALSPEPAKKGKPKKMLVLDVEGAEQPVSAGISSEGMGVAAPREDEEDLREAVMSADPSEVDAEFEEDGALDVAPASEAASAPEKKELKKLPYIVVIIDELADLMMVASREVETYVARLAQMARAAGIHLMVATQRPSTDVVTGIIKANFPTRISFMLRSKPDSMTILGTVGAEALLGMGDMLIMPPTSAHLQRVHGAFVSENEIKKAVDHLRAQGKPVYDESILKPRDEDVEGGGEEDELSDELYDQALAAVSEMRSVSISMLQRKMRIGYNRAARMIERMERDGIVGAADGAKPREVLIRGLGDMPGAGAM
ncbi:DNA translocase FtsK [Corallococcus sp. H22C18031201]|uniref:FtsK/SpoIIIE family DNA translocase n=1 Tax=Citreicoccus inhibens TaxID=2849499 RepID=UPI000E732F23|nr:DNA translocase FtsK 4TM domain-containing protein [Citreicoccus inhibens]MBU8894316.1 DNA translocase FtsK 4TM domain-containing protein [Citreicoccus inhibens]RJS22998.1 DNA translocase FtsK [Corallococcus sp. H22C18031201]